MAWTDDLETVIARTKIERYRFLTSDENPDAIARERYRAEMTRMATEPVQERPRVHMPSVYVQALNLWRSIREFVKSGGKLAPKSVRAERQATCNVCPHWNGSRCLRCGCTGLKLYAAAVACPDLPPRWGAYQEKS
jgi:hypothetical protein